MTGTGESHLRTTQSYSTLLKWVGDVYAAVMLMNIAWEASELPQLSGCSAMPLLSYMVLLWYDQHSFVYARSS